MPIRHSISKIIIVVLLYWFISITLVFINKHLLSSKELKLDAPLFVTAFQALTSFVLCIICSKISEMTNGQFPFPRLEFRLVKVIRILPLSFIMLMMICFNNYCLRNVNVSFYFIGRSLTIIFNVIFTFAILRSSVSLKCFTACFVICCGFWLGIDQEEAHGSLSWSGLLFGVLASASVALNAIYTKKALPIVEHDIWKLTFYNNFNAIWMSIPLIIFTGELSSLQSFAFAASPHNFFSPHFWSMMLISGVFGFGIGSVTGLQIKVTSPLSHNVSGTAKSAFQTLVAAFWFESASLSNQQPQQHKSLLWWFSNVLVVVGSVFYAKVRHDEMKTSVKSDSTVLPLSVHQKDASEKN